MSLVQQGLMGTPYIPTDEEIEAAKYYTDRMKQCKINVIEKLSNNPPVSAKTMI